MRRALLIEYLTDDNLVATLRAEPNDEFKIVLRSSGGHTIPMSYSTFELLATKLRDDYMDMHDEVNVLGDDA